ncbi:MAG: ABC transporter ATP-binding protein, partial [Polyangiaceae bacterium]|nr:ABC transporter ATP-binding protein [Polyangiaceae bacterium]
GGIFRSHAKAYALGGVVLGLFQLSMNRIDWFAKDAVDQVFGPDPSRAIRLTTMMLGLAVVAFVTRVASRWFIFNAGREVEYELREVLLRKLHVLGTAFYRTMPSGEIMSRATQDLTQVRLLFGFGILNLINVVFAFVSALQVMLGISMKLSLVSFLPLPPLVLLTRFLSKRVFAKTRANQDAIGKLSDMLQTHLSGVRVVRSFAIFDAELGRFRERNKEYLDASLALARLRGSMFPLMGAAAAVGMLAFFWLGSSMLLAGPENGGLSKGDFFAFSMALGRMTWPMIAVGFSISIVQRGRAGLARCNEIFNAQPELVDGPTPLPEKVEGIVRVSNLTFKHGSKTVLDHVSFEIKPGESVALVGKTGSGKSTLAMLLARLLPTEKGSIFLDGKDVTTLPLRGVRRLVGYAQQDSFLFSTTVARNIGYSLQDPDAEETMRIIETAAKEAQIFDEASDLPEGMDTVVGERGVQLSGGQKQRVALARALAWTPRILILDDPMSAVDARTEARILEAIEKQARARTLVLVTHRVAAAARCSRIIVLDQGKIVETGTHQELLRSGGVYALFAKEQQAKTDLEAFRELDLPSAATGAV